MCSKIIVLPCSGRELQKFLYTAGSIPPASFDRRPQAADSCPLLQTEFPARPAVVCSFHCSAVSPELWLVPVELSAASGWLPIF